jgi:hypothetical protein
MGPGRETGSRPDFLPERSMERPGRIARLICWLWFLAWGAASSAWCVTAASQLGPTFDEVWYIRAGLVRWRTGCHGHLTHFGTMPLPVDVQTLPLALWERWRGTPFDPAADLDFLLPWARAGTLVFWWLLLFYGWRTGQACGGAWGGALAVTLLACEPTLLAHAGLATTDLAVSACLLALVYHFRTARGSGWLLRVGVPTLWFAAAVLAKASGLLFGPVCLLVAECDSLRRSGALPGRPRQLLSSCRDLASIVGLGLLLVVAYCGNDHNPRQPLETDLPQLAAVPGGQVLCWLAEHARSWHNALAAVRFQVRHNTDAHPITFLLGEARQGTFWYYFPAALAIKLSVPLLLLPVGLVLLRPRCLGNWACLAALALLLLSPAYRVQIGVRFVLPLVGLAAAGLAGAAGRAWGDLPPGWRRRALAGGVAVGLLWMAEAAVAVWPHGLCYTNELWGGTANGYRRLSDSNYDWGQGLPELAAWQRRCGVAALDVWYFGTDPALARLPLRAVDLQRVTGTTPAAVREELRGRRLAVSTTRLYGSASRCPAAVCLRSCRPVARTTTFLIYDFTREVPEPASGVR